ncbi:HAMP domain-containing protein [Pseudodesulfovibrio cashew]|uniref:HAMP domain-containing protein n=1 Tax=Pseudodesulfovibrio cashew TaxID=2678688 RepID=A0A6I6JKT1_9BACT|nr:methyl-accepting chemotaxis protein [Pseudodesulfovibrio cashew]QGY41600.1 HAMP domain-containing protein [Pseudodesulfovibrio cashew]
MGFKSVNSAITLLIAAVILVTAALGVWWVGNSTYKVLEDEEKSSMGNVVNQAMAALDEYMAQTGDMTRMLASQQAVANALNGGDPLEADWLFKDLLDSTDRYWAAFAFDKNGRVVAGYNAKGTHMAGADRSDRGYVKAILSGESDLFLSRDILISKSGGGIMIFAAAHVIYDHNGDIIGGVGLFPKWENFTSRFIDPCRVAGGTGYAYMLDAKGRFIAHGVDRSLFLKDYSSEDFVQTALESKDGSTYYEWQGRRKFMVFRTQPKTGWVVVMSAFEDDMVRAAYTQRNYLAMGAVGVALLLIAIMVLFVRRLVIGPVQRILEYSSGIAKGDLDTELNGSFHFEFKTLSEQIQAMVGELKTKLGFSEGVLEGMVLPCGLIGADFNMMWLNQELLDILEREKEPDAYVGMTAGEFYYHDAERETLSHHAIREKRRLSEEVIIGMPSGVDKNILVTVTPFYDMDGELLGSLSILIDMTEIRTQQKLIEEQNQRISEAATEAEEISHYLSSAAEELSAQIEQAQAGADTQKNRASETATAMEQMNATVLEVARNAGLSASEVDQAREHARRGEDIVRQVIEAVGEVQAEADNLKSSMQALGKHAADIGKILEVITDIADQTNLLALNAAIEAARAGDAGRGFAVVADEVRKLAEKTMNATSEVGNAITQIQAMTQENVQATDSAVEAVARSTTLAGDSGDALREIVAGVEAASDRVRAIAAAAEEQSATSEQINRATDEINHVAIESSRIMEETTGAIQELASLASRLNGVIESMAGS